MGCKASKPAFSPNELEQGKDAKSIEVLQNMLDFTQEDLNNYHDIFLQINDGLDGVFPIQDVIKFLRLHDNDLVKGILKFFDTDASGGLDFLEFCCAVWNFLSISDIELSRFGFFLVTKDLEGEMTAEMFKNAIELITGKKVTGNVKTAYDQQCLASNDVIDLTNWVNFNVKYSFMISNLKVMQVSMAKVIFGQPYWNKEVQKRKNDPIKSKFKYVLELIKVVEGNNARSKKEAADARFRKNNEKKRLEAIGGNQLQSQNQAAILGAMGMDARKNAESQKRQVGIYYIMLYYIVSCIISCIRYFIFNLFIYLLID